MIILSSINKNENFDDIIIKAYSSKYYREEALCLIF